MSPITKIALRRLRQSPIINLLLSAVILLTSATVSVFLSFEMQISSISIGGEAAALLKPFIHNLKGNINTAVLFLVLSGAVLIGLYTGIKKEENEATLAVLTSIGAGRLLRMRLTLSELFIIYYPAFILGSIIGIYPGIALANLFYGTEASVSIKNFIGLALLIIVCGVILISLLAVMPFTIFAKSGTKSVISRVVSSDKAEEEINHGYRSSETFKKQALPKKLAKKSISYHKKNYTRVTISFIISMMYPIISAFLILSLMQTRIVIDENLYDGIDTANTVISAVNQIILFLALTFLLLTALGIAQAVLMSRIQLLTRKKSSQLYHSLGMTKNSIDKMMRYEIRYVVFRSIVGILFIAMAMAAVFRTI